MPILDRLIFKFSIFPLRKIEQLMNQSFSENSESESEILQPIAKFNPPNEIISKNYAADEKPVLKLLKIDKPEHQTCLELKKNYRSIFQASDSLGYETTSSLSSNIIYLKLNNQNYLSLKTKNSTNKYLSGMFIPKEKLLTPKVKASKNIYRTLPEIEYTDYKTINFVEESFGKNSKVTHIKDLKFSSNYDSANLFIAIKKKQFEYDLVLQNDLNSKGNTQWFNFIVEFPQEGTYRFNILNFTKSYSHFQDGMRILYFSHKDYENGMKGWTRGCTSITYERSNIPREDCDSKKYYCMKFDFTSTYPYDKVVFSYFYPYTGLDLEKFLKKVIFRKINVHMKMEKNKICETISGLPIYVVSVQHKKKTVSPQTSQNLSNFSFRNSVKLNRSVVFMARQHPGESQGSFLAEGIIEFLMENGEIDYLKKNIEFYILPMINPDGVLYGNYRTNLAGTDLNRIWRAPRKDLHPEVYYAKKYLHAINKNAPISMIIDLHGHSKSLNSFFYGNPVKKDQLIQSEDPRLFPFFCSKKMKQISFTQSTFSSSEDKKNSARVVLSECFPKALVYTLENSFYGWKKERNIIHEYTPEMLKKIGRDLVVSLLEYDRIIEKNPQIKEKWLKQIAEAYNKERNYDDNSDSEAEIDLISVPDDELEKDKSLFDENSDIINLLKRSEKKQNFIQRNLVIKSNMQRRYNRYNRNFLSLEPSSQTIKKKKQLKENKPPAQINAQGFLSIIKIKTNDANPPLFNLKNIQNMQNMQLSSEETETERGENKEGIKFVKENMVERLKKKRIKIEEAVHSCSGMRSFLRTMGIPLEKKVY